MSESVTVTIFGGGIAGLTAAHELVERGFTVRVIEPAEDRVRPDLPAVGGVARTQWVTSPAPAIASSPALLAARPAVPPWTIYFVIPNDLTGVDPEVDEFLAALAAAYGTDANAWPTVQVTAFGDDEEWAEYNNAPTTSLLSRRAERVVDSLLAGQPTMPLATPHLHRDTSSNIPYRVELRVSQWLPGEHGFRYFPGFYRHVFDTMKRTPISDGGESGYHEASRTVFDNLVATQETHVVTERRPKGAPKVELFSVSRRPILSPRRLFDGIAAALDCSGMTLRDANRLILKVFQYMTSCEARRDELEDVTWWDFIGGSRYAQAAQRDLERGPEILGAMSAFEADARTQGTCLTQLALDQLVGRPRSDATLTGPTSMAWFNPWREYLAHRGVSFERGRLEGFEKCVDGNGRTHIVPRVAFWDPVAGAWAPIRAAADNTFFEDISGEAATATEHLFVLAAPLPALIADAPGLGLAADFLAAMSGPPAASDFGSTPPEPAWDAVDFRAIVQWADDAGWRLRNWNSVPPTVDGRPMHASALRHLIGVQYFFPVNVQLGMEHTLYFDSAWRLSSISQVHFWSQPDLTSYRGILSVDIGALHTRAQPGARTAWEQSREGIARTVWEDVRRAASTATYRHGRVRLRGEPAPEPFCFHLDENVQFGGSGILANDAPYLINRPREWRMRPGRLDPNGYELQASRWVLAGCHMKTFTRLTTMEAANESGRHAVNGILHALGVRGDRCRIWDPEEHELDDLKLLRELDARLHALGQKHLAEALRLEDLQRLLIWL